MKHHYVPGMFLGVGYTPKIPAFWELKFILRASNNQANI